MSSYLKNALIVSLILISYNGSILHAQEDPAAAGPTLPAAKPPVMKTVFFNTALGSAWGAVMGIASQQASPGSIGLRESAIFGTTIGGILGYGFGILFVIQGVKFDENLLPTVPTITADAGNIPAPNALDYTPSLSEESRMAQRKPIFRWQTTIFKTTF